VIRQVDSKQLSADSSGHKPNLRALARAKGAGTFVVWKMLQRFQHQKQSV